MRIDKKVNGFLWIPLIGLFVTLWTITVPGSASAQGVVNYEADVFPEDNLLPFTRSSACDTRFITAGVLNIQDTSASATCTSYFRNDGLIGTDDAFMEFRLSPNPPMDRDGRREGSGRG